MVITLSWLGMETSKTMVKESWINGKYAFLFAKGPLFPQNHSQFCWYFDTKHANSQSPFYRKLRNVHVTSKYGDHVNLTGNHLGLFKKRKIYRRSLYSVCSPERNWQLSQMSKLFLHIYLQSGFRWIRPLGLNQVRWSFEKLTSQTWPVRVVFSRCKSQHWIFWGVLCIR